MSSTPIALSGTFAAVAVAVLSLYLVRRRSGPTPGPVPEKLPTAPDGPRRAPSGRPLDGRSVPAAFEAVARTRPDQVALRTATHTATYADLLAAAHTTATGAAGVGTRVALVPAQLSPATVSTILGLFASRTPLVVVDPALPENRIRAIRDILTAHGYEIATAEVPAELARAAVPDGTLGGGGDLDDVTSIQFTSGSTGAPKAVMHTHGMWLCDAELFATRFGITDGRRIALGMPVSFGAGLNVLIGSLLCGAEVVAVEPRDATAAEALDRIASSQSRVLICTPAFLVALHEAARGATLTTVERIVTTGEPPYARHVRLARELAPRAVFTNWVGSSEASAISTHDIAPDAPLPDGVIPAGIPAPHKKIELAADGAVSITSAHLALGYLDPAAASSRFVRNPDGTRTFLGGDVGRLDEAGNLILLGRTDSAVKVRGYLVEPAEIESALLRYDDVREAVVTAAPGETATLIAHVSPSSTTRAPAVADLRNRLHRDLPPWMVPAHIVTLPALPRTERGKVDRMALPQPVVHDSEPPQGELETAIARMWRDVLAVEDVGRTDSFYELGGDSLTVTTMLREISGEYGVDLNQSDLASASCVADFATKVAAARRGGQPGGGAQRLAPSTVPLRPTSPEAAGAPLHCFTGAGASSLCFVPLKERLGPQTAVYAYEPKGLERRAIPDLSIERAARRHLTDLRRIQPHGPYVLLGHSLGSHIALEAARLLNNVNEQVELLIMLDPWLPPRVARTARKELPDATVTLEETVPTDVRSWWDHQKSVPLAGLIAGGRRRRAAAIEEAGLITGLRYQPRPWHGRALLVQSHLNRDDPRMWPRIVTGELGVHVVACDHDSIVREPYIGEVVERIHAARDRIT